MSKLIMLRGNSGSGKTSAAKELQKLFGRNTMLISQDVVRRDMLMVRDGADNKALPLLIDLMCYGSVHSEVVILEGILNAVWYRPLFETAIERFGANIFAYYYDLPFEETVRRHRTKPNCRDFGEADLRAWWKERDWIGFIPEKTLNREISLEDTVQMILRDVTAASAQTR